MKHRQTNNVSIRKREVTQPQQHTEYYLFNSQGNLKAYSDDIMDFAYYGYNAANTRTYKLSLYNTNIWINGQQEPLNMQLQQAMFYPNTYLNFNGNGEYTKHYYNGTERIASRLGDNTTTIALNNNILEARKLQLEEQFREDIHKLIEETVPIDLPPFIDVNALQPTGTPNDIYYYHPNHLGSTSFVTDQNQNITQGFLYAPFGEITTEYNINFGNNVIPKYSFNAKELDEETGMYYYEARYYRAPTFTSRDPLFEKYFWMSPYAYCANNPVKYVDPDGKTPTFPYEWSPPILEKWKKLSRKEKSVILWDVQFYKLGIIEANAELSKKMSKTYYPDDNGWGDKRDAFRHALWQALNVQSVGERLTRKWANAHEYETQLDAINDLYMDVHNNEVGIEVGLANQNASPEELSQIIKDKISNGDMLIFNKNGKLIKSNGTLINSSEIKGFDTAKKIVKDIKNGHKNETNQNY